MGERLDHLGDAIINVLGYPFHYRRETRPTEVVHRIKVGNCLDPNPGGITEDDPVEIENGEVIFRDPRH